MGKQNADRYPQTLDNELTNGGRVTSKLPETKMSPWVQQRLAKSVGRSRFSFFRRNFRIGTPNRRNLYAVC